MQTIKKVKARKESFIKRNKKQIKNYKQFVGWCLVWTITGITFLSFCVFMSAIILKIIYG